MHSDHPYGGFWKGRDPEHSSSENELVPPTGRMAVGMKVDPRTNFLFVAGGTSGGRRCTTPAGALKSGSIPSSHRANRSSMTSW